MWAVDHPAASVRRSGRWSPATAVRLGTEAVAGAGASSRRGARAVLPRAALWLRLQRVELAGPPAVAAGGPSAI